MKRCPTCHQDYTDDNLNFCLADGAALSPVAAPVATVSMPAQVASQTTQVSRRGVSPVLAYAGIALLILLIGGAIMMWVKSDAQPAQGESTQAAPLATASPTPAPKQDPVPKLYRIVGVAEDDVLYIRDRPGPQNVGVGKIPADGVDIRVLEGTERVGQSTWVKVNYKGMTGWVNRRFLREQ